MRGAKTGAAWLVIIIAVEGLTALLGQRVAVWGAAVIASLLLLAYALLRLDFNFLQPWLWHAVGGLLGVSMVVGVVAAFI
jgi:hypothetical protein